MLRNNFSNYISRNMNYRNELFCAVKEYKNTMTGYEENNMPKDLSTGETLAVKKAILDQKVKLYVTMEAEIKDNICKMNEKNWGNVMMPCKACLHIRRDMKKINERRT